MSAPIISTGGQPLTEVRLVLPWPPSGNRYWRSDRGESPHVSPEGKRYKALVAQLCIGQRALKGTVVFSATLYPPTLQSCDPGNRLKVLEDSLELVAYLNDNQVRRYRDVAFADGSYGKKGARVEPHLTGQEWASREEVEAERRQRAERAAKARMTRNRNRAAKARVGFRMSPSLRMPTRRDDE
ncbi:RusA family crossover junction endodeoxyribonuclease [Myxococcus llanfairpwllgwyngyllgogerychwyrndrobwllllantysiliogogogochensis]|uniref:RusA family crossover junction endodeoxyribonuclease n=1 Tax=Myxococcus llanfairpwllgwyngyllgogerychwyrndrobwllllantysiliogogogochensis TaxID=2590453 RepID=A0A540WN91_9BACT|nr:RusA family crossover junction endodeoxyribonuclease [Myxococcus llanfairpwllgwyngyllgogerychwyrndrobwllllantysiliogogogochensis]TQF10481.1 RusA family crossover junction endodeoxyribonuclease [Myxococcus llanfairpwllgwyngyllgogerychwyrndrobwllllantysiliogogogochensis]